MDKFERGIMGWKSLKHIPLSKNTIARKRKGWRIQVNAMHNCGFDPIFWRPRAKTMVLKSVWLLEIGISIGTSPGGKRNGSAFAIQICSGFSSGSPLKRVKINLMDREHHTSTTVTSPRQ
jgi:hypothetical protein